jgi:AraC family transcriptional regulator
MFYACTWAIRFLCRTAAVAGEAWAPHSGQFCIVPAGTSTGWIVSRTTKSLLLRLTPSLLQETAYAMGISSQNIELAPSIHIRDQQIEHIGWMMQAEENDAHPGGRPFADCLASALATRLLSLQFRRTPSSPRRGFASVAPAEGDRVRRGSPG